MFFSLYALFFLFLHSFQPLLGITSLFLTNSTLVTVGCRKNSLFFLVRLESESYLIFQYPNDALNVATSQLTTKGVYPENVSQVFSEFGASKIINSALVSNDEHHDIIFAVRSNWRQDKDTAFFDLDSDESNRYFIQSPIDWDGRVWISASEINSIYQLQTKPILALQKYAFNYVGPLNSVDLVDANELVPLSDSFNICRKSKRIFLSTTPCVAVIWQVTSGMLYNEQFYFFGADTVYVFDKRAFDQPGLAVNLMKRPLKTFFK